MKKKSSRLRHIVILCHQGCFSQHDQTQMLCSLCIDAQIYAWTSSCTPRTTTSQSVPAFVSPLILMDHKDQSTPSLALILPSPSPSSSQHNPGLQLIRLNNLLPHLLQPLHIPRRSQIPPTQPLPLPRAQPHTEPTRQLRRIGQYYTLSARRKIPMGRRYSRPSNAFLNVSSAFDKSVSTPPGCTAKACTPFSPYSTSTKCVSVFSAPLLMV